MFFCIETLNITADSAVKLLYVIYYSYEVGTHYVVLICKISSDILLILLAHQYPDNKEPQFGVD